MSLQGELSVFGQKLLQVRGAIEIEKLKAQFHASIAAVDLLGIIKLQGKKGNNITVTKKLSFSNSLRENSWCCMILVADRCTPF
jgi:hypothetical protein